LKFYFRYGAHLRETEEVEESAEANTFGSILHLSLENLYRDFCGKIVSAENLKAQMHKVDEIVNDSFIRYFDNNAPSGKNLLQQEVIKVYVKKLVGQDLRFISHLSESNQFLTLIHLEEELSAPIEVTQEGRPATLYIKGKMDRLDNSGGILRIIDYKSSVKDSDKFTFNSFTELFDDCNYNKQLQLFIYAWLAYKNNLCEASKLMPCIIPFKVFTDEPIRILGHDKKPLVFNSDLMRNFETALKEFIEVIINKESSFTQTSDDKIHQYCPYNAICNFKV
jgi:ATP-dependent helicase/DNAse subunit B